MADMSGLGSLLENKLFLQYLAGAGADISAGNPIGQNVNAITQQNIQSQNFAKMLAKMMGKGIDFKSDEKGLVTIKGEPGNVLGGDGSELGNLGMAQEGSQQPGGSGTNWNQGNVPKAFNPFL